ncbi:MAG TPA: hypothetical protein VIK87_05815 [Sphingomonadales bacterium]
MTISGLGKAAAQLFRGLAIACGFFGTAQALPVMVDYHSITPATVETFEDEETGISQYSIYFNGFRARSEGMLSVSDASLLCGAAGDQCLTADFASMSRIFDEFAADTVYFGFYLHAASSSDVLEITAVGASGTETFTVSGSGYYAFADDLGLTSITINNFGMMVGGDLPSWGDWTLDDVITATADQSQEPGPGSSVPAPGALALFALGGIMMLRRRMR